MNERIQQSLAAIIGEFSAESGSVHVIGKSGVLELVAALGLPESVLEIVKRVPVGKGMAGLAAERNCAITACNIQTDTSGAVRPGARATGMEGAIVVPIRRNGRVVGTVGIANRQERTFSEVEQQQLLSRGSELADLLEV